MTTADSSSSSPRKTSASPSSAPLRHHQAAPSAATAMPTIAARSAAHDRQRACRAAASRGGARAGRRAVARIMNARPISSGRRERERQDRSIAHRSSTAESGQAQQPLQVLRRRPSFRAWITTVDSSSSSPPTISAGRPGCDLHAPPARDTDAGLIADRVARRVVEPLAAHLAVGELVDGDEGQCDRAPGRRLAEQLAGDSAAERPPVHQRLPSTTSPSMAHCAVRDRRVGRGVLHGDRVAALEAQAQRHSPRSSRRRGSTTRRPSRRAVPRLQCAATLRNYAGRRLLVRMGDALRRRSLRPPRRRQARRVATGSGRPSARSR